MIAYLKGKIQEVSDEHVIIVTDGGVGYKVNVPAESSLWSKIQENSEIEVYTSACYRENDQELYGFSSSEERAFFELLTTVSGVGPKLASTLLAHISHKEVAQMIISENASDMTKVPGIGKKVSERLILDLKDKVLERGISMEETVKTQGSANREYVSQALKKLGFNVGEIDKMIEDAEDLIKDDSDVESILQKILTGRDS